MVQTLSIRTKLIIAMLAVVASVALMSVTADAANAAGVTEIRWVENHTPYYVYVWNYETKSRTLISPHSAVPINQPVPWATSKAEFKQGKYIELGFTQWFVDAPDACHPLASHCPQLAIWQQGDKIRHTRSTAFGLPNFEYTENATPMPGASNTGGRRNLIIWPTTHQPTGWAVMQARLCC